MGLFDLHFDFGNWTLPFFRRRPKSILIVEDDPRTTDLIRHAAESEGILVQSASTAEEALGILHSNGKRFIAALVDVGLPSMDGWRLRKILLESYPSLPVIVMSSSPQSFAAMPEGERLSVLIKPSYYGPFIRTLL